MIVGYARVSSVQQGLGVQMEQLTEYGCDKIFSEKKSGQRNYDRPQLLECLTFLREGDTLVITRLDRLGRNMRELLKMIDDLEERKINFKVIKQGIELNFDKDNLINAMSRMFISNLAIFAEFENSLRKERQAEGIAKALANGTKWGGKPMKLTKEQYTEMIELQKSPDNKLSVVAVAKKYGISRPSYYLYHKRYMNDLKENNA